MKRCASPTTTSRERRAGAIERVLPGARCVGAFRRAGGAQCLVVVICALALAVSGCDRSQGSDASATTSRPADPRAKMRVVTLAPNAAETIAALGCTDQIVGVSDFCVYPAELTKRPRVGGIMDPDLEEIVLLKPDLVVIRGRMPTVESLCEKRGIALHLDETNTLDDIFRSIESLGARLGVEDRAQALEKRMHAQLDALHARVAKLKRPRVLMIVNRDVDAIRNVVTFGRGAFVNELIELAGGVNVFGDQRVAYPQVSVEQILAAKPDVIIEAIEASKLTDDSRKRMNKQWRALPGIPAVKNDRVYFLTEDYLLIPSPRVVDSVRLLSSVIHPEVDREQ